MNSPVVLSYQYRIYPTVEQEAYFCRCIDGVRWLYNEAIDAYEELDRWRRTVDGRETIQRTRRDGTLTQHKKFAPWVGLKVGSDLKDFTFPSQHPHTREWGRFPLESVPARAWKDEVGYKLPRSYRQFLKGSKGRPSHRSSHRSYSIAMPLVENMRSPSSALREVDGRVELRFTEPKLKKWRPSSAWVEVAYHRPLPPLSKLKQLVISKKAGNWYATFQLEVEASSLSLSRPALGTKVGVDVGVAVPAYSSQGPLPLAGSLSKGEQTRLATLEKKLDRQRRSNCSLCKGNPNHRSPCRDWRTARVRRTMNQIAALRAKQARRRSDWTHKVSHDLASNYETVVFEDLKIANMTKSAAGTIESPGTNVAQKRGLNRSILESGWGMLADRTAYKVALRGSHLIKVDPRNTSRTCAACGHVSAENRKSQSVFCCVECGHSDNADRNAAINILARGLGTTAEGHSVAGRGGLDV